MACITQQRSFSHLAVGIHVFLDCMSILHSMTNQPIPMYSYLMYTGLDSFFTLRHRLWLLFLTSSTMHCSFLITSRMPHPDNWHNLLALALLQLLAPGLGFTTRSRFQF